MYADMYNKHSHPQGAIGWDNTGNNKAYQSKQVIFVLNPTSIYAHLDQSDKELHAVTGLLPVPAGPAGAVDSVSTTEWNKKKKNPYPELAKGLIDYWMEPEHLRITIEEGGGLGSALSGCTVRCLEAPALSTAHIRACPMLLPITMNPPPRVLSTSDCPLVHGRWSTSGSPA